MAAVALLPRCWLSRHATKVARRHLTRGLGSSGQAPAAAPGAVATRIVYVTDCEGNLGYLLQCIELAADASSRGGSGCHADIRAVEHDGSSRLELADDAHFVFGGDTVDHGGRDIGVLSMLLDLKRRHPSRVHFLPGTVTSTRCAYQRSWKEPISTATLLRSQRSTGYQLHNDCHWPVSWRQWRRRRQRT